MIKHCYSCGCKHDDQFSCPPNAFAITKCKGCGNEGLMPGDALFAMSDMLCGQCDSVGKYEIRQATVDDMKKHWNGEYKLEPEPVL